MSVTQAASTPSPQPSVDPARQRLAMTEKLAYASGDFASCLYFAIFMNFLSYFYTDVFGLSAAAVGTMIFVTRTWDWINDPIMGVIADRTRSRWGKFRPWILWMIFPYIAVGVLTFTTFDLSMGAKLVYAYVTYTLLTMVYTAVNIPYGALMGVMTANSEERTVLASYRFLGAAAGVMLVSGTLLYLVDFFGQGNPQKGFPMTVGVYGVLAGAAFFILFWRTRERVQAPAGQTMSLRGDLKALLHNGPWLVMIFVSVITIVSIAIRSGSTVYYFKYVSGDEKWAGIFLTLGSGAQLVAVLLTKHFVRILGGKRRAFFMMNLAQVFLLLVFYFIPPQALTLILIHQVISVFVTAPLMPLFWSMIADTADYGAWKHGHRSTGLLFAAGTFSQKIGWSIGPALAMWALHYIGFVANVEQTPDTIRGLRWLMSIIPAFFALAAAMSVLLYKIDAKMEKQMQAELLT
jgi:glycoside/pentoside/hexuronide:cation symporter, GPH family